MLVHRVFRADLLTSSATMPLYGKFSDVFGRRAVFLTAVAVFLAGSVLCGVATTIWFLIGARALQGVGGGGLQAMVVIIIGDIIEPKLRPKYLVCLCVLVHRVCLSCVIVS